MRFETGVVTYPSRVNHSACFALALFAVFLACGRGDDAPGVRAADALREHSKEFERQVHRVADGVYSAVGYGIANSIMLVGTGGIVIVDAMDEAAEGRAVMAEFRKISALPVKAIVYTHSHPDHIFGAAAIAGGDRPQVYAHETTGPAVARIAGETMRIIGIRSMRMYGNYLAEKDIINVGIGPYQGFGPDSVMDYLPPTKTFRDRMSVTVAGLVLELIHAPGETDDQIYVWMPHRKILMCADNFYKAFPNLYTIRGTWFRSLKQWYRSVDIIRDLRPEILVPSHGRPLAGANEIYASVTDYRDAIQFVHDQSLRGMNRGMTPDELAEYVKLPAHLARSPYLQEFYGKVTWSARSMFAGNLGWFSGDPDDLQPLAPREEAQMMARIAGGEGKLLEHANDYFGKGNLQEALQLTGHLLVLDAGNSAARALRVKALTVLGEREANANARHYYLTAAYELKEKTVALNRAKLDAGMVNRFPLSFFFDSLAVNLDPKSSEDLVKTVSMRFADAGETWTIFVRRGVAETRPVLAPNPDILVDADSRSWKEMLAKLRSPVTTLLGYSYEKGSSIGFGRFLRNFEAP